jgi:F-type H+-transporting ATPase subunit epsilon
MARTPFEVEVLTPEGEAFREEVEMVSTRTAVGSIGILAHHQPLLGVLEPAELRLYRPGGDVVRFAQGEGYVQVADGRVLLLVQDALRPEELDAADLRDRLRRSEETERAAAEGSEERRRAGRDRRRWEAFLHMAEGGTGSR